MYEPSMYECSATHARTPKFTVCERASQCVFASVPWAAHAHMHTCTHVHTHAHVCKEISNDRSCFFFFIYVGSGGEDWAPRVCVHGKLITGQVSA
jgi:hypothetical protein